MNERYKNTSIAGGLIAAVLIFGVVYFFQYQRDSFELPIDGDTEIHTVAVVDGEVGDVETVSPSSTEEGDFFDKETSLDEDALEEIVEKAREDNPEAQNITTKEIMVTDGVKHSVPLFEIQGGGPPKDGIPPIDNPEFISISDAESEVADDMVGIAVTVDRDHRFYPFNILVWHEIVNDTFDDRPVLVSYCPLCLSGIVFDPMVQGERVEFGTSGKLWNSNLVMYDRKTDSLWSQVLGEAIVGEMAGTKLTVLPSDQIKFGNWKSLHPDGKVLSRNTGAFRDYDDDPYGDYYTTPGTFFSLTNRDDRLPDKTLVLGVVVNGEAKAYVPSAVEKKGSFTDKVGGEVLLVQWQDNIGSFRISNAKHKEERINPFPTFWFAWVAAHPDTELYK